MFREMLYLKTLCCLVAVYLSLSIASLAWAQTPTFVEANTETGFAFQHTLVNNFRSSRFYASGPAAADYDRDGDIDLFLPQAFGLPDELYRNNGDGTFTEAAAAAGVAGLKESRCALWVDYDNDGWLDLFVFCDPDAPPGQISSDIDASTAGNLLYRNLGDGTFADVTVTSGDLANHPNPIQQMVLGGAAAADINADGYLDIFLSCWNCQNALYENNGDGTFTERGVDAGVETPEYSWAPMFIDIDRDDDMDLLVNVDFGPNALFLNDRSGNFLDAASVVGFDTAFNEMGMAIADYDRDGDLDIFSSNIEEPFPASPNLTKYSILLRNQTQNFIPAFTDQSESVGVRRTGWGWGCTWIDGANDTHLDLAVTNGWLPDDDYSVDQSCYFNNTGTFPFVESGQATGFADTRIGRGLIAFDYDLDGDADLCETNSNDVAHIFKNVTPNPGNWIEINLVGAQIGNPFSVGAEVSVTTGNITQRRLVAAGTSFLSQEPYRQHFGLGSASIVDQITVRWPNGSESSVSNVAINRVATISFTDGLIPDMNLDREFNVLDVAAFSKAAVGQPLLPMHTAIADLDGNQWVDGDDIAQFVNLLLQ